MTQAEYIEKVYELAMKKELSGRILVVDDDQWQANFIRQTLALEGFDTSILLSGETLFHVIETETFDAVVLDLTLPDEDGIVLARKLRARSGLPIIVVTSREALEDKLASFEVGADDFLTKPIEPKELAARLRAMIRRTKNANNHSKYALGAHAIDLERREVIGSDGRVIFLTPAEYSLIAALIHSEEKALHRSEILDAVSEGDGPQSLRAVDILVSRVRKKLGKELIETVTGTGYRLAVKVGRD